MFYFKVILIALASLSIVQADDKCGAPEHHFSIDKYGATNCGSSCEATVIFSGYRKDIAEYLTIDMITDNFEPNKLMTLLFWYNNQFHSLSCTPKSIFRKKDADGLQCNWKLELNSETEYPITNYTILDDLLVNEKVTNYIYFGLNGHTALVATSLTHLIPYQESFPDCNEYDVITFYDSQRLNKITLSKKEYSITGFIYSLENDSEPVDRSIEFFNADGISFAVECTNSFKTLIHRITRYGLSDFNPDGSYTKFSSNSKLRKCSFIVQLKIVSRRLGYHFDFTRKPIMMLFINKQSNAVIYEPNIKFKFD